ncbi:hypothetical protein HBI26_208840 [Parastagonospora nodorum]|nr:hypothetical protein HBI79_196080 [Parastagonospora nodorum]KAH5249678.1 hypothetical protein HBI71_165070 [Parastagonospora nodorum]KAH5558658.1 hypothetical protein HBI26_208840 [Parastagonospora nodorum]KAH5609733.1 hypothetical protein HBI45_070630 [Parastagonospora nodorum]KAH5754222.1 hypothetical protein HBI16_227530 [Parastagonospora nodorum]
MVSHHATQGSSRSVPTVHCFPSILQKTTKKAFGTAIAIEHPIGKIEANKGTDIITKHDWRRKSRSITTKLPFSMSSQKARCIFQTGVCT